MKTIEEKIQALIGKWENEQSESEVLRGVYGLFIKEAKELLKEEKQPIFKDELSNDVYEQDSYYYVCQDDFIMGHITPPHLQISRRNDCRYFKNKSDAEQYLIMNSKFFSIEDVMDLDRKSISQTGFEESLKELAKQKLNLK
jgi:hypothetical protein